VQRDFTASGPNRLWVGDLTYLRCGEGVVFFAFILDAYGRRIVGWQFDAHMRTELVLDALRMAIHQRGPVADVELVAHTDRLNLVNTPASPTPTHCMTPASSPRSDPSATPTTLIQNPGHCCRCECSDSCF
jgi:transposase InsO family protein